MHPPQLEVCPFCAHTGELTDSVATRAFDGTEAFGYTVLCNAAKGGCGATCGYWETEAEAADRWNNRARAPAPRENESGIRIIVWKVWFWYAKMCRPATPTF